MSTRSVIATRLDEEMFGIERRSYLPSAYAASFDAAAVSAIRNG